MLRYSVLLFGLLALVACAPANNKLSRDSYRTQEVVRDFVPDRGEGANYKLGEFVRFSFNLAQPGFVTVVSADQSGIYELERNLQLGAGTRKLPVKTDVNAQGESAAYRISPPVGLQRVILLYTDAPGPAKKDVKFEGAFDNARLEESVKTFFERSGARVRDLQELTINVEKP
jgi:hypothetical protein